MLDSTSEAISLNILLVNLCVELCCRLAGTGPPKGTQGFYLASGPSKLVHRYNCWIYKCKLCCRLSESGQPEVVYTLVDTGPELQHPVGPGIHAENSTGPVTIPLTLSDALRNDTQYIVRAEPRQDTQPPTSVNLQVRSAALLLYSSNRAFV